MAGSLKYVFISHSNMPEDLAFCERLYHFLTVENRICAWMDAPDLHSGDWREQIYQHIVDASAYILVASNNSLIEKPDEVKKELDNMLANKGKPLIPIALDDAYTMQDKRKGSIGYELGEGRFQAVIMKNFQTERAAFERLLFLLPRELTKVRNNPNDFDCVDDNKTLVRYKGSDPYVQIPSFIQTIEKDSFCANSTLGKVVIPSSVRKIGVRAFYRCEHLNQVEGMSGVVDIATDAFSETRFISKSNSFSILNGILLSGDVSQKKLVLPEVRVIANSAFECCDAETVILSNTLEVIGKRAFADSCYISEIYIPKSVQIIGEGAFSGCIRLKKAIFQGKIPENISQAFDKNIELVEE